MGRGAHQEDGDSRCEERRGVEGERTAQAEPGDERAAQSRAGETECDRPDELVE